MVRSELDLQEETAYSLFNCVWSSLGMAMQANPSHLNDQEHCTKQGGWLNCSMLSIFAETQIQELARICQLCHPGVPMVVAEVYFCSDAAWNDLKFYKGLLMYHTVGQGVFQIALKATQRHIWYLTPEIVHVALLSDIVLVGYNKQTRPPVTFYCTTLKPGLCAEVGDIDIFFKVKEVRMYSVVSGPLYLNNY